MGVALGNNYLAWFETATAGTFGILKGQGTSGDKRSQAKIDTSSKETTGYSTGAYGNIDWEASVDIRATLPDAIYARVEAASNASTSINFQIRKNGAAGTTADIIFAALVNPSITDRSFNKDGVVDCKLSLSLAAAPTIDALA